MDNARKDVYTIIEKEDAKAYWCKIGSAWVNRDGSLNVLLNALPVNGKLHVRDAEVEDYNDAQEPASVPQEPEPQQRRGSAPQRSNAQETPVRGAKPSGNNRK